MQRLVGFATGLMILAGSSAGHAAPEQIRVPVGFAESFVPYAIVDKRDREPNVVRFMYIDPTAAAGAAGGQPLPPGTQIVMVERIAKVAASGETVFDDAGRMIPTEQTYRIIVSEKRPGVDAEYDQEMRIGDWEFGVFQPDGSPWADIDFNECRACHKHASQTDYTFSVFRNLASIKRAVSPGAPNPTHLAGTRPTF